MTRCASWRRNQLEVARATLPELESPARPARDKLSRLKQPEELIALGERLMDEAEAATEWSARRRAIRYRDGLLIALRAYRPVRRRNLAMMRLGRHLMKVGGRWRIVFGAEETKTHVPYEAVLPAALGPRLERYLDVHRPVLLRAGRRPAIPAPCQFIRNSTRSGCRKWEPSSRM